MLVRNYSGYGDTETEIAKDLHNLAAQIANARKVGDKARVARLWGQFQARADDYRATGASERAILALVNHVHDSVIATLQETAQVAGGAAAGALGLKSLWPFALAAVAIYLLPHLIGGLRARRA